MYTEAVIPYIQDLYAEYNGTLLVSTGQDTDYLTILLEDKIMTLEEFKGKKIYTDTKDYIQPPVLLLSLVLLLGHFLSIEKFTTFRES